MVLAGYRCHRIAALHDHSDYVFGNSSSLRHDVVCVQ